MAPLSKETKALLQKYGVSVEVYHAVQTMIDGTKPPNTKLQELKKLGLEHSLAFKSERLKADEKLTHGDNRDHSIIDWYQSHTNLMDIKRAGANSSKLDDSMCFEFPPDEHAKKKLIDANQRCITAAGGHLAPISGRERFADVGCSHFWAGVKATLAGCKTPLEELGSNGRLSKEVLVSDDPYMLDLVENGWSNFVWKGFTQLVWPSLPSILEGALNSSNAVSKPKSELQCFAAAVTRLSKGSSTQDVETSLLKQNPICKEYMSSVIAVADILQKSDTLTVQQISTYCLQFGETKRLGQEFLDSLASVVFHGGLHIPEAKLLLMLANLISDKCVDGLAKFITKTDIKSLQGSKNQPQLVDTAASFKEALACKRQIANNVTIDGKAVPSADMQLDSLDGIAIRAGVRMIIHDLKKGKASAEQKDYASKADIKALFIQDMENVMKEKGFVCTKPWKIHGWEHVATPAPKASPRMPVTHGCDDPASVVKRTLGGEIGDIFYFNVDHDPVQLMTLPATITGDVIVHTKKPCTSMATEKLSLPFDSFTRKWKKMKLDKCPTEYKPSPEHVVGGCFLDSETQYRVWKALKDAETTFHRFYAGKIAFISPLSIYTLVEFAPGQLTFAPYTSMSLVSPISQARQVNFEKVSPAQLATTSDYSAKLGKPAVPLALRTDAADDSKIDRGACIPYWWVKHVAAESNMELDTVIQDNVTLPIMRNKATLPKHTELTICVPKVKSVMQITSSETVNRRVPSKKRPRDSD